MDKREWQRDRGLGREVTIVEADSTRRSTGGDHTGVLIREATEADLDALVQLGKDFNESTPYSGELVVNAEKHRAIGAHLITSRTGALLMAEVSGRAAGMIGVAVFPHVLSDELTMAELFFFVDPKHRGSVGVRLLKAAEKWAVEKGAVMLQMTQPIWAERVGGLYEALGYHQLEIAWTKRVAS